MTRMSGPLKIKRPFEETTVASIDVSGSAKFAQGASFTGEVVVTGSVKATRLQVGTSASDSGDVLLCRQIAVPNNTTKNTARIPDGCDIVDITAFIQTPPGGSAQSTCNILVGVSADDDRYLRITNVTAQGFHRAVTSTQSSGWNSVSGASAIITVHTSAVSGAIASGTSGRVNVFYVKRQ